MVSQINTRFFGSEVNDQTFMKKFRYLHIFVDKNEIGENKIKHRIQENRKIVFSMVGVTTSGNKLKYM